MHTFQLMQMLAINDDGSVAQISALRSEPTRGTIYLELRARSVLDLSDLLEEFFCKATGVNTEVHFNGSMAPGSGPEVRVYVGRVAGCEQTVVATLLKVSR